MKTMLIGYKSSDYNFVYMKVNPTLSKLLYFFLTDVKNYQTGNVCLLYSKTHAGYGA